MVKKAISSCFQNDFARYINISIHTNLKSQMKHLTLPQHSSIRCISSRVVEWYKKFEVGPNTPFNKLFSEPEGLQKRLPASLSPAKTAAYIQRLFPTFSMTHTSLMTLPTSTWCSPDEPWMYALGVTIRRCTKCDIRPLPVATWNTNTESAVRLRHRTTTGSQIRYYTFIWSMEPFKSNILQIYFQW